MSRTIDSALEDDAIDRTERGHDGYSFWLKDIPVEILVMLYVNPQRGGFNFRLSHNIHTPTQAGPYYPSLPWGDDEAYALHMAVSAITSYYREAVKAGHKPSKKWLIPANSGI